MSGRGNFSFNPKKEGKGRLQQEAREQEELEARKQEELKAREKEELKAREQMARGKVIEDARTKYMMDFLQASILASGKIEAREIDREVLLNGFTGQLYHCELCGEVGITPKCDTICDEEQKARWLLKLKAREARELKDREPAAIEAREQRDLKAREQEELKAREYDGNGWAQQLHNCELCGNLAATRRCRGICDPERKAKWLQGQGAREEAEQKYRERKAREQEERKARKQEELKAKEQADLKAIEQEQEARFEADLKDRRAKWKVRREAILKDGEQEEARERMAREKIIQDAKVTAMMADFRKDIQLNKKEAEREAIEQEAREQEAREQEEAREEAEQKYSERAEKLVFLKARIQKELKAREQEDLKAREQAAIERAEKEAEKYAKELPKIQAQNTFIKYCKDCDLEMVKSLLGTVNIRDVYRNALFQAVENGHIEIVKLVCDELYNKYPKESVGYTSYNWDALTLACGSGHLELAKHLVGDSRLDVSVGRDEPALTAACANGHLEIAQWIASQNKYISTPRYVWSFRVACERGHFEVVRWIFRVEHKEKCYPYGLGIYEIADGFFNSCSNGHLNIVQWLFPILNSNGKLKSKLEDSFSIAGGYKKVPTHPEVVNWLLQQRPDLRPDPDPEPDLAI